MGVTLTTLNAALRIYQPRMATQVVNQIVFFSRMKTKQAIAKDKGRKASITLKTAKNQAIGNVPEGSTLPAGGNASWVEFDVPRAYTWVVSKFTEQSLEIGKSADMVDSLTDMLDEEMEDARLALEEEMNRLMYNRDASGAMAKVSGSPSGSTITLDVENVEPSANATAADTTFDTKYLQIGQKLDTYTARTSGSKNGAGITITGITESTTTPTITVDSITNVAANDYVLRTGNYGNEQVGLFGAIGLTNNTYMTIDRTSSANFYWLPRVKFLDTAGDGTGTRQGITDINIQEMVDVLHEKHKSKVDMILTTSGVVRGLQKYFTAQGRYDFTKENTLKSGVKNDLSPETGKAGIEVRIGDKETTFLTDFYCPKYTVFYIDTSTWKLWQIGSGFSWANRDGNILKWTQPADGTYSAYGKFWVYPVCDTPKKNGCHRGVAES